MRPPTPATLTTLRELNAAAVFDVIRRLGPISRAEIARAASTTKPTVGNALDLLLDARLVRPTGAPRATHYGAVYFESPADLAYVLALDVGRQAVRCAVGDLDGSPLARHDVPIDDARLPTILAAARRARDRALADLPGARPQSRPSSRPSSRPGSRPGSRPTDVPIELAVAGVPGVVDPREGIIRQASPSVLEGVPVRAELATALGLPVEVENDVNLAALGEQAEGRGSGVRDFAYLSIGTGVGAGLVLDGRLFRGRRGAAGEIDDPEPGARDASGSPSADALIARARSRVRAWRDSGRTTVLTARPTTATILAAAAHGDELARRLMSEQARRIAERIGVLTRVVDVELVVLGGELGLASVELLPRIRERLTRIVRYAPTVERSTLGDGAVLAGALAQAARAARESVVPRRIAAAARPATAKGAQT